MKNEEWKRRESEIAQQVKAFAWHSEFHPQDTHAGREGTPISCPLTYTYMHVHTRNKKCEQNKNIWRMGGGKYNLIHQDSVASPQNDWGLNIAVT